MDSEVFLSLKVEFKKIIDELGERFNFNELDDIIEPEGSTKIDLENDVQVPQEITKSTVYTVLDSAGTNVLMPFKIGVKGSFLQKNYSLLKKMCQITILSKKFEIALWARNSNFLLRIEIWHIFLSRKEISDKKLPLLKIVQDKNSSA